MTKSITLAPKHKRESNIKLVEANIRLAELEKQHGEIEPRLEAWQKVSANPEVVREQVEAALAGKPFGPVQPGESPEVLRHRQAILKAAIARQTETVRLLERQHAEAVCKDLGPVHKEAVEGIAQAVVTLAQANAREAAIRDAIESAGMTAQTPISFAQFPNFGHNLADWNAPAAIFLRELVQQGLLTGRENFLKGTSAHRDAK